MSITTRSPRHLEWASKSTVPTVGPGTYETDSLSPKDDSPYPFLTTSARFRPTIDENPSPDTYDPVVPNLRLHAIGSTMCSVTPRKCFEIGDAPSPSDHSNIANWQGLDKPAGNRTSMMSRSPRPVFPSPAAYKSTPADYNLAPPLDRGALLGHDIRFRSSANGIPGPGTYREYVSPQKKLASPIFLSQVPRDIHKHLPHALDHPGLQHPTWSPPKGTAPFSVKSKGRKIWTILKNPSPAQYNVQSGRRFENQQAPFGVRGPRSVFDPNANPGPADYDVDSPAKFPDQTDKPFLQREPRFDKLRQNNEFTGPGQYEVDTSADMDHARLVEVPSRVFKTSSDRNPFPPNEGVPGPGQYEGDPTRSHRLRKCMDGIERSPPGTFVGQKLVDTPGPGNYTPKAAHLKDLDRSGGYIRGGPRYVFEGRKDTVSPAKYDISKSLIKPSMNPIYAPQTE
jgi:hypothetical protein